MLICGGTDCTVKEKKKSEVLLLLLLVLLLLPTGTSRR